MILLKMGQRLTTPNIQFSGQIVLLSMKHKKLINSFLVLFVCLLTKWFYVNLQIANLFYRSQIFYGLQKLNNKTEFKFQKNEVFLKS